MYKLQNNAKYHTWLASSTRLTAETHHIVHRRRNFNYTLEFVYEYTMSMHTHINVRSTYAKLTRDFSIAIYKRRIKYGNGTRCRPGSEYSWQYILLRI